MRLVLVLLMLGSAFAARANMMAGSIDAFIADEMTPAVTPGLAYAVVDQGSIHAEARGETVVGSGMKVTPHTPFLLGSISKSFTAVAVMQLAEAGKLDLDDPISRHLKPFADQPAGAITIRQLLSHTSGYSTLQGNQTHRYPSGKDALYRQVAQVARWQPAHTPGTRWEYSNVNYQILGAMIEVLSGQDYATYITAHILRPISMTDSFVADGQVHDAMARGHVPWFGTKKALKHGRTGRVSAPQGGVIASANDMARYLAVMMNGEDDVISAENKTAMMRPASSASPFYGLGWFIDGEQGAIYHSGSSPGTETLASMVPTSKKGVVVLVNAGSGIGFGETAALRDGITARALGLDYAGEGSRWQQKAIFISFALAPLLFLFSMVWAWFHRAALSAKTGAFGLFSLWFPLLMTVGLGWALFYLFPLMFGTSLANLRVFEPDFVLMMIATAATGVIWAVFRLGLAYRGKASGRPRREAAD